MSFICIDYHLDAAVYNKISLRYTSTQTKHYRQVSVKQGQTNSIFQSTYWPYFIPSISGSLKLVSGVKQVKTIIWLASTFRLGDFIPFNLKSFNCPILGTYFIWSNVSLHFLVNICMRFICYLISKHSTSTPVSSMKT